MANGDDNLIHLFHTVWSALITLVGGAFAWMVKWNWDKLNTELDKKANKSEMADQFQVLRDDLREWKANQEDQHKENRRRLDTIIQNQARRRG